MTGPHPAREERELDVVVHGATGFVGKLTAAYLARAGGSARVGLAGRSRERLAAVRDGLGPAAADWPLLIADSADTSALDALARRTAVVISTVGPYTRYGLPLVAACAAAGTDYADLTAETMFIRECIDTFHKQAADTGARIVHSCGFDSVPSDLTVFALHRRATADQTGDLQATDLVLRAAAGGVSGGTIASGLELLRTASADPDSRRALTDPYTLSPDRAAEPELGRQSDTPLRRGAEIAPELAGVWTGAFAMAVPNARTVRRSNALQDWAYGRDFRYAEHLSVGSATLAPVAAVLDTAVTAAGFAVGSRVLHRVPRGLLDRILPKPGSGPSEQRRTNGHYRLQTYTTTSTGARYRAEMSQQGDPGYQATSVLLGECALALAFDRERLSDLRGVVTPAAAMGTALLDRFPGAGVRLEVERLA